MSKDGYETELTRIQSKRNLFKFIKTYLTKEANFVSHPEGFWWKRAVFHKRKAIEESFQQFILNNAPQQEQEDFAYEGIFDKNKEPDATPMKGAKRLESNFINGINRSTINGEELKMLHNASNTLINNEQSSDYSKSPHSSNSRQVGISKMKLGICSLLTFRQTNEAK